MARGAAMWLVLLCALLGAVPCVRADADYTTLCTSLAGLAARPEEFRFAGMEEWDVAARPNCCGWAGVTCARTRAVARVEQLFLFGAAGNASFFDVDFRLSRLHIVAEENFAELPGLSTCTSGSYDNCDTVMVEGRSRTKPRLRVPDWAAQNVPVRVISFANVRIDNGDLRRLGDGILVTLRNVHVETRDVTVGLRSVEMTGVSGMERLLASDLGEPTPSPNDVFGDDGTLPDVVARGCPDLVETSSMWAVRRPAAATGYETQHADFDAFLHYSTDYVFEECARLEKVAHRVHGPARIVLRDLPKLLHLPVLSPSVREVEVTRVPHHLLHTFRLPTRHSRESPPSALERLSVRGCGLTHLGQALPSKLQLLDLSHNKLTEVPAVVHNATVSLEFVLDHNAISTLPTVLPHMHRFSCAYCNLTGVVDVASALAVEVNLEHNACTEIVFAGVEEVIEVGWNRLEALTFPQGLLPPRLRVLSAPHNKLRALSGRTAGVYVDELPVSFETLDVSHNELTGLVRHIPWSLHVLRAAHNRITEVPPLGTDLFSNVPQMDLVEVDLSYNEITTLHTGHLRDSREQISRLEVLNIEHNQLSDWTQVRRLTAGRNGNVHLRVTQEMHSPLVKLYAGGNNFTTPHDGALFHQTMNSLRVLLLGHNAFTGPVPVDLEDRAPSLATLHLAGSGFAMPDTPACRAAPETHECMGTVVAGRMVQSSDKADKHSMCPVLAVTFAKQQRTLSVDIDPSYHHRTLCECVFGYWRPHRGAAVELVGGTGGGECVPAPPHTVARGGKLSHTLVAERGHWMCADVTVAACPRELFDVCAPDSSDITDDSERGEVRTCSAGATGYLCADCADGWYRWASSCRKCPASVHTSRAVAALAIVAMVLGGVVAAFVLDAAHDAAVKLGVFALQCAALLGYTVVSISPFFKGFLQLLSVSLLEVPYLNGCVLPHSAHVPEHGVYVLLALALGLPLLVFVARAALLSPAARTAWAHTCARAACVLYWLAMQRAFLVLPLYFQCEASACAGAASTSTRFPFAACARAAPLATYLLVFVPLPVAALWHVARVGAAASPFAFLTHGLPSTRAAGGMLALQLLLGLVAALRIVDRLFAPFFAFLLLAVAHECVARSDKHAGACTPTLHVAARCVLLGNAVCFAVVAASHAALLAADGQRALDALLLVGQTLLLGGVGAATLLSAAWTARLRGLVGKWAPVEDSGL